VSPFRPEPALLAVGPRRHAWWPHGTALETASFTNIGADQPDRLRGALDARRAGKHVDVVLDDAVARFLVVRPGEGVVSLSELRAVVAARLEDLFGLDATAWCIEADWQARRPFLACALPTDLLQVVRETLPAARSIAPAFVHCLAEFRARQSDGWLLHATAAQATVARLAGGTVTHVRSSARPDDLGAWLAEQALLAEQPRDSVWVFSVDADAVDLAGSHATRPAALARALQLIGVLGRQEVAA